MAEWVSHLIVADKVLEQLPWLKRHEFCVGKNNRHGGVLEKPLQGFLSSPLENRTVSLSGQHILYPFSA